MASFQNFLIMPLTMLSGVFYSIYTFACVLAGCIALQSCLLHDRRLPLWLFGVSDGAGAESDGRRSPALRWCPGDAEPAEAGLEAQSLRSRCTPEHIKQLILAGMACDYLELDGDGQHFQAIIVSSEFVGKNRVQRQQRYIKPCRKTGDRGTARLVLQNPDPGRMERPAWISC